MRALCVSGKAVLSMGLVGFASFAFAAGSAFAGASASQELIVRYREPQNNLWQATTTARRSTANKILRAEILSSSEGVLKLRFNSDQDADLARAQLELSSDVLSVSRNLLYSPAVHYSVRDAAARQTLPLLSIPFFSMLASTGVPAVQPAPTDVVYGADPLVSKDWAMSKIGMPAHLSERQLTSVVTAVIDTGVDYNHEDLSGAMWRSPNDDTLVGMDFAHNNALPYDVVHFDIEGCLKDFGCKMGIGQGKFLTNPGHGTHCAGHVGAVANNSLGIRGVGSNAAQIMGIKFFYDAEDDNAGQGDDAAAIKSIDFAIQNGAKVISASWGGRQNRTDGEASELKQAFVRAQKAGLIVVVAAGNDGINQDKVNDPVFPAAYDLDNMIVVAATDSKDQVADFSNFGAKSVHIGAPGVRIFSTTSGGSYSDIVAKYKDPSGKTKEIAWDGTSMATPIVAGAVSLVWAKYPHESYQQIRARILNSARQVSGLSKKVVTGGVLNVEGALE